MIIKLQTLISKKNEVNKQTVDVKSEEGTLKNATSITDPILIISGLSAHDVSNINYVRIPDLNRAYYVEDIVSLKNNLWEIHCHVDVLESYKNYILTQYAIIGRQENVYNLYLDDSEFKIYQNSAIITKTFPGGFNKLSYVLAMAGNG